MKNVDLNRKMIKMLTILAIKEGKTYLIQVEYMIVEDDEKAHCRCGEGVYIFDDQWTLYYLTGKIKMKIYPVVEEITTPDIHKEDTHTEPRRRELPERLSRLRGGYDNWDIPNNY